MRGIILAAGRGSRLGNLGDGCPKCLVELGGRPLLDFQRNAFQRAGISDLAVVSGYRAEHLSDAGLKHFSNPRWADTGVVASLLAARSWLESGPCIVSYADIVFGPDVVAALMDTPGDIALTSYSGWRELWEARFPDPLLDAETFQVDADGRLVDIGRRAGDMSEIQGQFMGLVKWTPRGLASALELLRYNPGASDRIDMTTLLRGLLQGGVAIQTRAVSGFWYEVDNAADVELYPRWIARSALRPE